MAEFQDRMANIVASTVIPVVDYSRLPPERVKQKLIQGS